MNDKISAVALAFLMVTSVAVVGIDFEIGGPVGTASAAASNDTFQIVDAGNAGGQMAIVVEANTTSDVSDFSFYYEAVGNSRVGPMTLSNGDVASAKYPDGTAFTSGDAITLSDSSPDRAIFYLDSGTAPYTTGRTTLNATSNGQTYSGASDATRDVATANWQHVTPTASDGTAPAGVVPFLVQNANTNQSLGNVFVKSGGAAAVMCRGVNDGGSCTDPETGTTATHTSQAWSARGGGFGTATGPQWQTDTPVALTGYNLAAANTTDRVTSSGTTTAKTTNPGAPVFIQVRNASQSGSQPSYTSLTITNRSSGNVVFESDGTDGSPAFLRPGTQYKVEISNPRTYGTERRYLTLPTKGMTMATFLINQNMETSTVTGQIVDENGNGVSNAVVMAERSGAFSNGYRFYNATATDSNGLFSMTVPESSAFQFPTEYQFTYVSNESSSGTLTYYPTTDDNGGDGYTVRSSKTVVPQFTMKNGGKVAVDLSQNGGGNIQPGLLTTTLGKYTGRTGARTRSAVSESFTQISFGKNKPASAEVALMSPTTDSSTRVGYNVWGVQGSRPTWVCANDASVSQGSTTTTSCAVSQAGYINLSVDQYDSIIQQSGASSASVGDFSFFFENELLIRDSSTGEVVTYLGRGSGQVFNLGAGQQQTNTTIPVPAGSYVLELRPATEWSRLTTVNDTNSVSVTAGSTADVTLDRGQEFGIERVRGRSDRSLTRGTDNTFAVNVTDPATGAGLTGTNIDATAHFAYPNGTKASSRVDVGYNSTAGQGVFDTTTLKPSSLGLDAGSYDLIVTASHTNGARTYNTTSSWRVRVSDFQTALDTNSGTVAPGDTVVGSIAAYDTTTNPPSGIDASASDVDIEVYDENGNRVTSKNPSSGISSGDGSFSVTMPSDAGVYRVLAFVKDGSGNQGIAERWIRVSKYDVSVTTDKQTYSPSETVQTDVAVTNATDGSAVDNASVEVSVNGDTVGGITDGDGEFTASLNPATFAASGTTWSQDNFVRATVYKDTSNGVFRKTSGSGFRVQSFDMRADATSSSFASSDDVVLDVGVDSGVSVKNVAVTAIDGQQLDAPIAGTEQSSGYYQVNMGTQSVGDHDATVTVTTQNSGTEQARAAYRVQTASIAARTDKFTYDPGESIDADVTVRDTSGNALPGKTVTATLYASESPPRQVGTSVSDTTASDGTVTLTGLSSSGSGLHIVEIDVNGQTRRVPVMISDLSVKFEDGSDNTVGEYQVSPGTTKTVTVDATAGGAPVADGTTVDVGVVAYGEIIAQSNAEITNGAGDTAVDVTVPDGLSSGTYTVLTRVRTTDGKVGSTSTTLNVTGGTALDIQTSTGAQQYAPGDTATLTSRVTDASGSPVSGKSVVFVLDAEGSASETLGTKQTGSDGTAALDYSIPSDKANGDYVVRTYLSDAKRTQDYSGFTISSLTVDVSANQSTYEAGDTMGLTVNATDDTGSSVDADTGQLRIAMPSGNEITQTFSTSGTGPYTTTFTIPSDNSSVGDVTVAARVTDGQSAATSATLTTVESSSESATLTVPDTVTAGASADLTLSSSVSESATLTVFPPATSTVAVNRSVSLTAATNTTESVTLSSPGTYVFKLSVPNVGTVTEIREVTAATGTAPTLTVGTAVGTSNESVGTSEDIYIQSDTKGTTAEVISGDERYEVALNQKQGDTYYGVLSETRASGTYLVRLDSADATAVNETIMEVDG
jgi:protocatechuate 3,4-dioxygenase beta subunit